MLVNGIVDIHKCVVANYHSTPHIDVDLRYITTADAHSCGYHINPGPLDRSKYPSHHVLVGLRQALEYSQHDDLVSYRQLVLREQGVGSQSTEHIYIFSIAFRTHNKFLHGIDTCQMLVDSRKSMIIIRTLCGCNHVVVRSLLYRSSISASYCLLQSPGPFVTRHQKDSLPHGPLFCK